MKSVQRSWYNSRCPRRACAQVSPATVLFRVQRQAQNQLHCHLSSPKKNPTVTPATVGVKSIEKSIRLLIAVERSTLQEHSRLTRIDADRKRFIEPESIHWKHRVWVHSPEGSCWVHKQIGIKARKCRETCALGSSGCGAELITDTNGFGGQKYINFNRPGRSFDTTRTKLFSSDTEDQ